MLVRVYAPDRHLNLAAAFTNSYAWKNTLFAQPLFTLA
jgi:hypothetical protein